ncbi:hypothetical protein KFK14_00530 [Sphingobium phenoxybenzoativorans]|uniref:PAS domain-containing protein n=1 Tax=Sphingobium phenoxybenzoativorans TaxID=1592790 RepID=A0A975K758_9SPHN|nr:hypothetical protein [Sphingobium phenoxybenzoativorans]QUT06029.1 hypothetical protein KFK14_00530 [Sphingobium phenoxybenzoativorans]
MDTLRGRDIANDHDEVDYAVEDPAIEAPPEIGSDERRMHVRAYNYWASLLGDRALPSIEDLNPSDIEDFGPHSVLLDFTVGVDDPAVAYLGGALRRECEIERHIDHISEVPSRSLLSRLTDHYLQILANAAPIGFEAEFINQRGAEIVYRGILMPFSSDGDTIDFIYGVINWKEMASRDLTDALVEEVDQALRSAPQSIGTRPIWADGPSGESSRMAEFGDERMDSLDDDAGLADRLALARDFAQEAGNSDARTRSALYRAIGLAHDFALATRDAPEDYAEMLEDAGIAVQARSPMTAVIKLIFGVDYDKTRVTEYATILDYAQGMMMPAGSLADHLEAYIGGIKGLVRDVRASRRPEPAAKADPAIEARAKLRVAPAIAPAALPVDADGLAVVVARREADGSVSIVAALPDGAKLTQQVIAATA